MSESLKQKLEKEIIGAWKLVKAEDLDEETGKWEPAFGEPPSGYFFYDASGYASIQIMTVPPQKKYTGDEPTPEEALAILNGYLAYYGPYSVSDDGKKVTVKAVGNLNPNQVGVDQPRPTEIKDGKLYIGDPKSWIRVLERM